MESGEQPAAPPSPSAEIARLSAVMDAATAVGRYNMRSELGRLQREAAESQDRELAAAVRVEGNAYLIFETAESFEQYQETLPTLLFSDDLPYFRARARTPNLLVRARYLDAIAASSERVPRRDRLLSRATDRKERGGVCCTQDTFPYGRTHEPALRRR